MLVKSILHGKGATVVTTRASTTVGAAARLLHANRIGVVVVVDDVGHVAGILSERDIVRGMAMFGEQVHDMPIGDLMSENVLTCGLDDSVESLMAVMTERRVRHLPVLEEGRLLGIISIGDVVKNRLDEATLVVDSLRDYVTGGR
ncbi:MAG: CBS domain-containing protein [Alphaproteobacteria bacterium]|nr:CBS domain-containing protein [Alphaproteobacteria bacterium]